MQTADGLVRLVRVNDEFIADLCCCNMQPIPSMLTRALNHRGVIICRLMRNSFVLPPAKLSMKSGVNLLATKGLQVTEVAERYKILDAQVSGFALILSHHHVVAPPPAPPPAPAAQRGRGRGRGVRPDNTPMAAGNSGDDEDSSSGNEFVEETGPFREDMTDFDSDDSDFDRAFRERASEFA